MRCRVCCVAALFRKDGAALFFFKNIPYYSSVMAINDTKVLVLMSGGVDSSVSAALLKQAGYDVTGVYLKLWEETDKSTLGESCWAGEMRDAGAVAAKLGIPFTTWDVTQVYKERVLKDFYAEYAAGRTPNPDVLCNSEVKFGIAYDEAMKQGFDFVATGHYARNRDGAILTGLDSNKDQSYFLWKLKKEQLAHILFPVGNLTKPEVRAVAQTFDLHNAEKKDSQGVCFLGQIDLQEFLKRSIVATPGEIIDVHGKKLGVHENFEQFTVGQREGLKIGGTGPYFVIAKDIARHAIIVAHESEAKEYAAKSCTLRDMNWFTGTADGEYMARPRYRATLIPVSISGSAVTFLDPDSLIAEGQSIVFYSGEQMVGGGVIDTVELAKEPVSI